MEFSTIDIVAFVGFLLLVIGVSLWASRKEETSEDYFLAGRGLSWWVIGLSLIASNISTEHFIGMAGQGFSEVGLAIASYEWIAAFTLILVALFLLPRFLRSGIYTIPEFLEYRYNRTARTLMSVFMLFLKLILQCRKAKEVRMTSSFYVRDISCMLLYDPPLYFRLNILLTKHHYLKGGGG